MIHTIRRLAAFAQPTSTPKEHTNMSAPVPASRPVRLPISLLIVAAIVAQLWAAVPARAEHTARYVSPSHGYSLFFRSDTWRVVADSSAQGYDVLSLTNGVTEVVLEGARNRAADAESCVYDELRRLANRSDVADVTLRAEGALQISPWNGYFLGYSYIQDANEARARNASATKWCGLIADGSSLVITQISPSEELANQAAAVGELLAGLQAASGAGQGAELVQLVLPPAAGGNRANTELLVNSGG